MHSLWYDLRSQSMFEPALREAVTLIDRTLEAQCTLSVVADYEWDAFGLPDLKTDWYVRRLAIEHRQIDDASRSPGRVLADRPGKVLRSFEIERMSRWDDDRIPGVMAWYLLDVTPLRAS
jgi:hypothetical protein